MERGGARGRPLPVWRTAVVAFERTGLSRADNHENPKSRGRGSAAAQLYDGLLLPTPPAGNYPAADRQRLRGAVQLARRRSSSADGLLLADCLGFVASCPNCIRSSGGVSGHRDLPGCQINRDLGSRHSGRERLAYRAGAMVARHIGYLEASAGNSGFASAGVRMLVFSAHEVHLLSFEQCADAAASNGWKVKYFFCPKSDVKKIGSELLTFPSL